MFSQEHKFCMDMSVLETQQARFKCLQQQQQLLLHDYAGRNNPVQSFPVPQFLGFFDVNLPKHGDLSVVGAECAGKKMDFVQAELAPRSLDIERCLSRTSSCQIGLAEVAKMEKKLVDAEKSDEEAITIEKLQPSLARDSSIKRKVEFVATAEECKDKRIKEEVELQSKAKKRSSTEISSGSSKDERKDSQVQKQDYIHVRARRGQATDSHSLAERARREKISKKMKCLQDLVPGCNKVTGRAGMLDEIINYVQSLQRQVEFLSMKLATLNSCQGLNVDSSSAKEFPAYIASFRTAAAISSAIASSGNLQLNLVQQHSTESELEVLTNPAQVAPERSASCSTFNPEAQCLDSSCVPQVQPLWDSDVQNRNILGIHQW